MAERYRKPETLLTMVGSKIELTTLFADVSGSTGIYEQLGTSQGRNIVWECVIRLRSIAEEFQGRFIKSDGDDIMCTFSSPSDAVLAACAMQCYFEEFSRSGAPVPIGIRIGFQHGIVVSEEEGDVRGDAVNVAARLADYAKAGQIVTSEETLARISLSKPFRLLEQRVRLKGKAEKVNICEILWKQDFSMTVFASEIPENTENLKLLVQLGEQSHFVSEFDYKVTIGRDPKSNIVVTGKRASRHHATIEFSRGTFVLTDISTNATYLRQGLEETRIHRQQAPIIGSGQLSLGLPFNKNPQEIIELTPHNGT